MIGHLIGAVNKLFLALAALMLAVMIAVMLAEVFQRYWLNAPSPWSFDVSRYLLLHVFFLGIAPALQSGHHVAVDLFEGLVPRTLRRHLPRIAALLTVAFGAMLTLYLLRSVFHAYSQGEIAQTQPPVPLAWVTVVGPVGAAQFLLTAIAQLLSVRLPAEGSASEKAA